MADAMIRGLGFIAGRPAGAGLSSLPALGKIVDHKLYFSPFMKCIKGTFFENNKIPVIPTQDKPKATIVFDFKDFLACNKFSLCRFDIVTRRRAFCEEFLYNLIGHYELISITSTLPAESAYVLPKIDPFGCITYRLCVQNKRDFLPFHLNRSLERVVILSTGKNEFSKAFDDNVILLPKWRGGDDSTLLDLIHFFNNLRFSNLEDYRMAIKSYRGTDFTQSFRRVQERLYNHRSMLLPVSFSKKLADVNNRKISEYGKARRNMEEIKRSEGTANYSKIFGFIRSIIL